ncbi:MAG: hypothetical protein JNK48_11695 [Bryobacterales bacterium]|nr:hypothetical protein [Bryobacterales bacterium]
MKPLAAIRALYYPLLAFLLMAAPALGQFRLVGGGTVVSQVDFNNPTAPLSSRFYVLESVSGSAVAFNATALTNSGGSWLSVKVYPSETTTGTTGNAVEIKVDPNTPTGNYTGSVLFQQQGNPTVQLSIPVTLTIGSGSGGGTTIPGFTANPSSISLTYVPGTAAPTQQITLSSNNGSVFSYSAVLTTGTNFVTVSSGNTGSAAFNNIVLTFFPGGLTASTVPYTGNLQITIAGQAGAINIPISLTVTGSGGGISGFTITPASMNLNSSTPSQVVTITPSNFSQAYFYTTSAIVSTSQQWLSASPSASTGQVAGQQSFTVNTNSTGLTPGVSYSGTIRVFINSQSTDIGVTFTPGTTGGGSITGYSVSPSSVTLSGSQTSQLVTISQTTATGQYVYSTSVSYTTGSGWLTVSPASSTNVVSGSQFFTISVNPSGLAAGQTYTANVNLQVGGQVQVIPVSYSPSGTGSGIPGFTINPTLISMSGGQTQQVSTITALTSGTIYSYNTTVTTQSGVQWLSVFPSSGQNVNTSQALTIIANPNGLAAGVTQTGTVRVTINGLTQDITVNFTPGSGGGGGTITGYTVNPTSIAFNANLTQQAVTILPQNMTTPYFYSTSVNYVTGANWLQVLTGVGNNVTGVQAFTLVPSPTGLQQGTTYNAQVRLFIGTQQMDIAVSYTPGGTGGGGVISGFTISPSTLNISGGSTQGTVQISPSNAGAYSYNTTVSTTNGVNWLSVSPASGTAASGGLLVFNVIGNSSLLAAGQTYTGTVRVTINNQTQDIAVNFTTPTGGGGAITGYTISPTAVSFNVNSQQQVVTIQPVNTTATYSFSLVTFMNSGQGWLTTNVSSGTGAGAQAFVITANPAGLITGQLYTGFVRLTIGNQTQDIQVSYTPGTTGGTGTDYSLQPASINFNVNQVSQLVSINPSSQGVTYSFTAIASTTSGGSWMTVTPSAGSGSGPQIFTVSANSTGLTPNQTYTGSVRVTVGGVIRDIPVTFTPGTTGGGGGAHVSPTSLSYSYTFGQGQPASQAFFITTQTPAIFELQVQNDSLGFLRLGVFGGTSGPNTRVDTFVHTPAILATTPAGTYTAQVLVKVSGLPDTVVSVTLTVSGTGGGGQAGYSVSPTQLNFSYTPGGQVPGGQAVLFTSPSAVNYTLNVLNAVANGITWLNAAPLQGGFTSGTTPQATLTVQPNLGVASLPVGTYTATIQVLANGLPVTQFPVTLTVGTVATTSGFVSPSSLSFAHQSGTNVPPAQILTVGTVGGAAGSFTATASTTSGGTWLSVTPGNGTAPSAIAVSVNPTNLSFGTYTGNIAVTFSGSGTTNIPVTLHVTTAAVLRLNLNSANFNYQLGGSVPASQAQSVEVSTTSGSVAYSVSASTNSGGNWLSVVQNSTVTTSTASIQVNAASLAGGTYTGTVSFTASGQSPITVPVTLTVSGLPLFNAVPSRLTFAGGVGITPSPQTVGVSTTGTAVPFTVNVTTSSGGAWLSAVQTVPGSISVSVNPAGLTDGTYYGAVTVAATTTGAAGNSPVVIPVVYQVGTGGGTGGGGFSVQPTTLNFTQILGGGVPPSQTLTLASPGVQYNYAAAVSTNSGGSWLSAVPTAGVTPATVTISVNAGSLPAGTYSGAVVVTATGAPVATQVINVTLTVTTAPVITASPTTLAFSSTSLGTAPGAQTVSLLSSGTNLNYSVAVSVGQGQPNWLEVTPASGVTPATLTVRPNVTQLAQGTYTGTITINLGLASPITIPVTFNYGAAPTPQIVSMTNAASFLPTAAAPGMIVAIFGSNLGPTTLQQLRLTASGLVDTNLNGVRVLFDNIPAPMVYARNDVISAIVPYAMAGRASANVVVEYQGVRSAAVAVRVVDASPGIFTTNQQGSGQGAILNNDFSLNGAGNPVARGQFATVYLTGEGQTAPAGVDGLISAANQLRNPIANVQVRVGDRNAQVIYAGSVPTTVLGLCQVSFFIPADAPTGNAVPLTVTIGGAASQTGVSIAVR